jgi:hypothetical protein
MDIKPRGMEQTKAKHTICQRGRIPLTSMMGKRYRKPMEI